jgi:hypothetical protein
MRKKGAYEFLVCLGFKYTMVGDTELTRRDTADKPNRGRCGQPLPSVSFIFSLNFKLG